MSFEDKQTVVVLCSSEHNREHWSARRAVYDDVDLELVSPTSQAWRIVKDLISLYERPVVICQGSVWFGAGFGHAVRAVRKELDEGVPKWGACGNRGMTWDGSSAYDYTRYAKAAGGVSTTCKVRPVLTLDDNLVLLNCPELRKYGMVDLGASASLIFGIQLSLECLRFGLPLLVSPQLFTLRSAQHTATDVAALAQSNEFKSYYSKHFLNHSLPWPDANMDVQSSVDYEYVSRPDRRAPQNDVLHLFDQVVVAARVRPPSLTLCCRTQFTRLDLLHRALTSFAIAQNEIGDLLDLTVCLISDRDAAVSDTRMAEYREEFPALRLECWCHAVRSRRYSRADLLIAAIERATTDYIWFVDDDDFVLPGAAEAISRTLQPDEPVITVGNSIKVQEKWTVAQPDTRASLESSRRVGRFKGHDIYRVFTGENFTPVCSMILPVRLTAERLEGKQALGDYNEDYFILLTALTAAQVEVRVMDIDICGVSLRDNGNTVSQVDRSNWNFSYATFMREVLGAEDRNPLIWQLGNAQRSHLAPRASQG